MDRPRFTIPEEFTGLAAFVSANGSDFVRVGDMAYDVTGASSCALTFFRDSVGRARFMLTIERGSDISVVELKPLDG